MTLQLQRSACLLRIHLLGLLTLAVVSFGATPVSAQGLCTPGDDIVQPTFTGTYLHDASQGVVQAFTATCRGTLRAVQFEVDSYTTSPVTATLRIYTGGGAGGTELLSTPITYSTVGVQLIALPEPVPLEAGQQYKFFLDAATAGSAQLRGGGGDPYTGGGSFVGPDINTLIGVGGDVTFLLDIEPPILVTTTADNATAGDGACTLREAITNANSNTDTTGGDCTAGAAASTDLIAFGIPGAGPHTIAPTAALPALTDPVVVDGTTQSGTTCGVTFTGRDLRIVLSGSAITASAIGLRLTAGSDGSTIRGLVINQFTDKGLQIFESDNNVVQCTHIGTDAAGTTALGNQSNGIEIAGPFADPAENNTIGGLNPEDGNLISGNSTDGVHFEPGGNNNIVQGNRIGTDITGTAALGNFLGVGSNQGAGNLIGGSTPAARNVIAGNSLYGVELAGPPATGNRVQGNYIGVDVTGTAALGNGQNGVFVNNAPGNWIGTDGDGTDDATEGNVISGNGTHGIEVSGASAAGNVIAGNYIGTTADGTTDLGNTVNGVRIQSGANGNTIGGSGADEGNLISGNGEDTKDFSDFLDNFGQSGVHITGAGTDGNIVQGNKIGTDRDGLAAIPNGYAGVWVEDAAANTQIGGAGADEGNLISGNFDSGVVLTTNATGTAVMGNYIGTTVDGAGAPVIDALEDITGNGREGIAVTSGGAGNYIGTDAAGTDAGNVISGNTLSGIIFFNAGGSNVIQGNLIGLAADGLASLGNGDDGILMAATPPGALIGSAATGAPNVIAYNGRNGVTVDDQNVLDGGFTLSSNIAILGNRIFQNGGLGIDLFKETGAPRDGVTPNDPGDADVGANGLLNYPELDPLVFSGSDVTVSGSINTTSATDLRIEFFANVQCDDSGFGEGQTFLGFVDVTTDGGGTASFSETFTVTGTEGRLISATATDAGGNTSEFAACAAPELGVPNGYVLEVFADGLAQPEGLALDGAGNVYVSVVDAGEVRRYGPDGTPLDPGPLVFNLAGPSGLALDGTLLYVSDLRGDAVYVFDVTTIPPGGVDASVQAPLLSGLNGPSQVTVGPDGNLYISLLRTADGEKVIQVDPSGSPQTDFLVLPDGVNFNPQRVVFAANGDAYVPLQAQGEVVRVPSGAVLPVLYADVTPALFSGLDAPNDVDFGVDGQVFIATATEVLSGPADAAVLTPLVSGLGGGSFNSVLVGDDNLLYVADYLGRRVVRTILPQNQIQSTDQLTYQLNVDGAPLITDGSDLQALRNAFAHWEAVPTASMDFTDGGTTTATRASMTDGVNLVTFQDDEFPFPPLVLGVAAKTIEFGDTPGTARIVDADIVFNPEFNTTNNGFATDNRPGSYDIESIATHEVGHVMGLLHSGVPDATMFFVLQPGTEARTLTTDDEAWAGFKYPDVGFAALGSIAGTITDGATGSPVAAALVLAENTLTGEAVHAYSDRDGTYLIPGLPLGDYKVSIQPLDGDVYGLPFTPANVSFYLQSVAAITDFQDEFYNGVTGIESSDPGDDDPAVFDLVTVNGATSGVDFITNLDLVPPAIAGVSPQDGAADVVASAQLEVVVTFSEPIDPATLTLEVLDAGTPLAGTVALENDGKLALFTPADAAADFLPGVTYTVRIDGGLADLRGNALGADFTSTFTIDSTPPTVDAVTPGNGAVDVAVTQTILVTFSEALDPASVTGASVQVTSPTGAVAGTASLDADLDNTVVVFDPDAPLTESTTYTVTLTTGVTDVSGNALAAAFTSTFTTVGNVAFDVLTVRPAGGATNLKLTTQVLIDFSKPIDTGTFAPAFGLTDGLGNVVPGTIAFVNQDTRAVFRPSASLAFGTTYTIALAPTVADVSGETLADAGGSPITSSFTTVQEPPPPAITSVSPESAVIGKVVVISGDGFSPDPASNLVSFNGVTATVADASLYSLTAAVPDGATDGDLTVTVSGQASDPFPFEVFIPQTDTDEVVARVSVERGARDADVTPDGTLAYVTNSTANSVSVIDVAATAVLATVPEVGDTPFGIAINPQGTLAYVTNANSNDVAVIDVVPGSPTFNEVIDRIPVGLNPLGIAITPDGSRIYVAELTSKSVTVIDADPASGSFNNVVARVSTESGNRAVEVSPDGALAFVTGTLGVAILDIDPVSDAFNSVVARVSRESGTRDVAVAPDGTFAFATTIEGEILVIAIDPASDAPYQVVARTSRESGARSVEVSPDGTLVYATNFETGTVSVYRFGLTAGPAVSGALADAGQGDDPVTGAAFGLTLVDTIPVGTNPEGLVFSPKANVVLVANSGSDDVSVIKFAPTAEDLLLLVVEQIEAIEGLNLGQKIALVVRIKGALRLLERGNTRAGTKLLESAIRKIDRLVWRGLLDTDTGQRLIDDIQRAIDQLNGISASWGESLAELATEIVPDEFALTPNYPNPFTTTTTLGFDIPDLEQGRVQVEMRVYNLLGQAVATLVDKEMTPGRYEATWNGRYASGDDAASGVYLIKMTAGGYQQVRKVVLVR